MFGYTRTASIAYEEQRDAGHRRARSSSKAATPSRVGAGTAAAGIGQFQPRDRPTPSWPLSAIDGRASARQSRGCGTLPIWRGWCQGVGVEGHGVVGVAGAVVAVREAAEAFAGFATFGHAHIRGLSQDLCSSHVRCLKSSAPTRGWVLRRRIAELCARAGMPRTASPTATGCQSVSVFVSASL